MTTGICTWTTTKPTLICPWNAGNFICHHRPRRVFWAKPTTDIIPPWSNEYSSQMKIEELEQDAAKRHGRIDIMETTIQPTTAPCRASPAYFGGVICLKRQRVRGTCFAHQTMLAFSLALWSLPAIAAKMAQCRRRRETDVASSDAAANCEANVDEISTNDRQTTDGTAVMREAHVSHVIRCIAAVIPALLPFKRKIKLLF